MREKLKGQELPFSPVQRRYTGYQKYSPRILDGLQEFEGNLRTSISNGNWESTLDALAKGSRGQGDAVKGSLPGKVRSMALALGLFANTALQSENEGTTTANLLARHLINEYYFALDDIATAAAASDAAAAREAWMTGREYLNAYLSLVNQVRHTSEYSCCATHVMIATQISDTLCGITWPCSVELTHCPQVIPSKVGEKFQLVEASI